MKVVTWGGGSIHKIRSAYREWTWLLCIHGIETPYLQIRFGTILCPYKVIYA